jgi:hypothetical protein
VILKLNYEGRTHAAANAHVLGEVHFYFSLIISKSLMGMDLFVLQAGIIRVGHVGNVTAVSLRKLNGSTSRSALG